MDLVEAVYGATRQIPSNIAEGHGRKSTGAYVRHLSIASGSLMELETQLQIATRLGYLSPDTLAALMPRTEEVGKMLAGLQNSLNRQS